ncbi:GTP cyclohydrolase II [Podila verticillata]|nr:GTP cyclohydrolase II [Podila verticillata]
MSLTEASSQPGFIPRNAIDHISPFVFKDQHSHSHSHSHSPHCNNNLKQQPYPDTPLSSLQTPVPRRPSIGETIPAIQNVSSSVASYSTPPATPPLGLAHKKSTLSSTTALTPDLIAWCTARARIPTPDGSEYFLHIYENAKDKKEHMAFVFGDAIRSRSLDKVHRNETELDRVKRGAYSGRLRNTVATEGGDAAMDGSNSIDDYTVAGSSSSSLPSPSIVPLARIHSECFTGEIGHSARCDCGEQLDEAIRLMKAEGSGVVVYLRQEGRGIGLAEKLKAYNLQDLGYDTVMANLLLNHGADERTYEVAQAILEDLGLNQVRLLTNNPDKIEQVEKDSHIKVVERVPMVPKSWEAIEQGRADELEVKEGAVENKIVRGKELDKYLKVKVERMRHLIPIPTAMA